MADLSIRIDFGPDLRVGPGKIALLEQIATLGSISAGGRAMDMSYRRAWELIEELNTIFGKPVVESRSGGKKGGGATLTPLGLSLIARYRAMEAAPEGAGRRNCQGVRRRRRSAVSAARPLGHSPTRPSPPRRRAFPEPAPAPRRIAG